MSSEQLAEVYAIVVTNYVDPVDHKAMLLAAEARLRESALKAGLHPLLTLPIDLVPEPAVEPGPAWAQFATAYDSLTSRAPEWASSTRADWQVLDSMMTSLRDPSSTFTSATQLAAAESPVGFIGVGVVMAPSKDPNGSPLIQEVVEGGPAEARGLRSGDRIMAVNGAETAGKPLDEIRTSIRGNPGTEVVLRIKRFGMANMVDVPIRRAAVQLRSVTAGTYLDDAVAALKIRNFTEEGVAEQVEAALQTGVELGVKGWIIDLRGNQGGDMAAIATVASYFVGDKPLGYVFNRDQTRKPVVVAGTPLLKDVPVAVLVNGSTASGSELLAAALKEYGVATVYGSTTAGDADLSQSRTLLDGSKFTLRVQHLETPKGVNLSGSGLIPDRVLETTDQDLERGDDPPLEQALRTMVDRLGLPPIGQQLQPTSDLRA